MKRLLLEALLELVLPGVGFVLFWAALTGAGAAIVTAAAIATARFMGVAI